MHRFDVVPRRFPLNPMNELTQRVRHLSVEAWGEGKEVQIEGDDPKLTGALHKLEKFAAYEFPLLLTGESGVGKELFAKAFYLLSSRRGHPFISVNCPQYQDGNLTVSELFGHKKGRFRSEERRVGKDSSK